MNCKPDVISLTETWIQPSSSGPYKNLNGYNFVSNCRNSCKGGGVAFYVKDKFHFNICDELVEMDEKIFESLFINLKMECESFLCGTFYRSPANGAMSNEKLRIKLQNCLSKIDVKEKCYIFGDFNYDLAQTWATYGPRAGSGPRDHVTLPTGTYKNMTLYRESSRTSFIFL